MGKGEYTGKRANLTFSVHIYDEIKAMAEKENRSFSQMALTLILEALSVRRGKNSV
jgi:hypothetical protein